MINQTELWGRLKEAMKSKVVIERVLTNISINAEEQSQHS